MSKVFAFGPFEVDLSSGELHANGARVPLREQCFRILASLLEHPGEVVSREELRHLLWAEDVFVDFESNLNSAVAHLRAALGDSAGQHRFVETLPKRGYRFVGEIVDRTVDTYTEVSRRRRLLVLPFVNLGPDAADEFLSDAITEELITELAGALRETLGVIARTTSMRLKNTRKTIEQIGRELQLEYVIEGGVRRDGDQMTITVQLVRASDQTHLFARRYCSSPKDVFEVPKSVGSAVAECLESTGNSIRTGRRKAPTEDLQAYDLYARGRDLFEQSQADNMMRATELFERALERDPGFALAHDGLADVYAHAGCFGCMRPLDAFAAGVSHAMTAIELDDTLAEGHAVLAAYHTFLDYNWSAAERRMSIALELNAYSPIVRLRNAVAILMPRNHVAEAISEVQAALKLDPFSQHALNWLGILHLFNQDLDSAVAAADRSLAIESRSAWAFFTKGIALHDRTEAAVAAGVPRSEVEEEGVPLLRKAVELTPGTDFFVGWLGKALGEAGYETEAREVLERLRTSDRYVLPSAIAFTHYGLGEIDQAFEWMDRAVEERDQMMAPILSGYGFLDPIRDDPRFHALVRKMKLA